MSARDTASDTACAFVPAYERLRAGVLEAAGGGRHPGLGILLREGTAAWMDHIGSSPTSFRRAHTVAAVRQTTSETPAQPVVDGIGADIVHVLVNMLTADRAHARTCS